MIGYVKSMRNRCSLLLGLMMALLFRLAFGSAQELTTQGQALAVCGDHYVLIIDAGLSDDTAPRVIWKWSALEAAELPEQYRTLYFRNIVECKPVEGGEKILVTAARRGGHHRKSQETRGVLCVRPASAFYGLTAPPPSDRRRGDCRARQRQLPGII